MASEERDRAALIRAAAEIWGEEVALTLSELLPPPGDRPATKRDIEVVLAAIEAMDERHDARMDAVDTRLDAVDTRLDAVDARLDGMESRSDRRLDERLDALADRMIASFERRISDAVTTQTRTLVFSQLGSLVVIAALAFGFR
jgi:uncharacterized membrane protein YccC